MTNVHYAAIAEQAYFLWLNDGMIDGRAEAHWAAAEKLLAKNAMSAAATAPKATKTKAKSAPKAKAAAGATRAERIRATETRLHS